MATYAITVDAIRKLGITGKSTLCVDQLTLLSDNISGGVWSISNANLLLDVVGNIAALYPGLDTVTYTVVNNCGSGSVSFVVTILSKEDCIAGNRASFRPIRH